MNESKIILGDVELDCLREQGMEGRTVPPAGRQVLLRKNSNISTGGDSIDFTDEMGEDYKTVAENAALAVEAKICGVDMMVGDPAAAPDRGNHAVIELNFNPALHIHAFPWQGINRHPEKAVLDLLKFF
jgi:D-alanine-D-alanine ligase-like ATP-grasp enzyme